jgi:hypothetical protein
MSIAQQIQDLKNDLAIIENSTSYSPGGILYSGSCGDSGQGHGRRSSYIKSVEVEFLFNYLSNHRTDVLKLAAKKIRDEFSIISGICSNN